jgi:uncharacterized protein (DUF58 family)
MLIAPLIFNWRVCVSNLRSLSAKRVVPEFVHALTPVNITWTCSNFGGRLTARNLILHDRLSATVARGETESQKKSSFLLRLARRIDRSLRSKILDSNFAHVCFQKVTKYDPAIASYRCLFPGRGKYELGPAELKSSFPFGLVSCSVAFDEKEEIYVAPLLGVLHPTWERRINSMETGNQSMMRRRGQEKDEFYAIRKWRSGDNLKDIHWRSTARQGFPMIKQFDQQNDRDFAMLLDLHSEDDRTRLQCETILSFAATALSQVAADVHGQVAVAICGEEENLIAGGQNQKTRRNVMRRLAVAKPGHEPEFEDSLSGIAGEISEGTPLYCFSTREKPSWLSSQATLSPALSAVFHLIRWIHVESAEFKELFSIGEAKSSDSMEVS